MHTILELGPTLFEAPDRLQHLRKLEIIKLDLDLWHRHVAALDSFLTFVGQYATGLTDLRLDSCQRFSQWAMQSLSRRPLRRVTLKDDRHNSNETDDGLTLVWLLEDGVAADTLSHLDLTEYGPCYLFDGYFAAHSHPSLRQLICHPRQDMQDLLCPISRHKAPCLTSLAAAASIIDRLDPDAAAQLLDLTLLGHVVPARLAQCTNLRHLGFPRNSRIPVDALLQLPPTVRNLSAPTHGLMEILWWLEKTEEVSTLRHLRLFGSSVMLALCHDGVEWQCRRLGIAIEWDLDPLEASSESDPGEADETEEESEDEGDEE